MEKELEELMILDPEGGEVVRAFFALSEVAMFPCKVYLA